MYWRVTPEERKREEVGLGRGRGQTDADRTISPSPQEGAPEQRLPLTESWTGKTRAFVALPCSVLSQGLPCEEHDLDSKAGAVGQTHSLQLSSTLFLEPQMRI